MNFPPVSAAGFARRHKPHLPFQAPPEFFDKFPVEKVSVPAYKTFPKGARPLPASSFSQRPLGVITAT